MIGKWVGVWGFVIAYEQSARLIRLIDIGAMCNPSIKQTETSCLRDYWLGKSTKLSGDEMVDLPGKLAILIVTMLYFVRPGCNV